MAKTNFSIFQNLHLLTLTWVQELNQYFFESTFHTSIVRLHWRIDIHSLAFVLHAGGSPGRRPPCRRSECERSGSSGSSTHDCSALPPNSCFLLRLKRHSGLQTLQHADLKKGEVELEDTSTMSHGSGNIQWAVIQDAIVSRQLIQMNEDQWIFMFMGEFMLIY